jgi:hypothetical protein
VRSGRFELADDQRMVARAIEQAEAAGVPRATIDAVVAEELRLDDDLSHPIAAARVASLIARRRTAPRESPVLRRAADDW